jgi:hypothetical protein
MIKNSTRKSLIISLRMNNTIERERPTGHVVGQGLALAALVPRNAVPGWQGQALALHYYMNTKLN